MSKYTVDSLVRSRLKSQRTCLGCQRILPIAEFGTYQYVTNQSKVSRRSGALCRVCRKLKSHRQWLVEKERQKSNGRDVENSRNRKYSAKMRALEKTVVQFKRCSRCGETKTPVGFYRCQRSRDGLGSWCRSCTCAANAAYVKLNLEKHKRWHYNTRLKRYGLTRDGYEAILRSQGGVCAVCGGKSKLCVDHDHKTSRVRGILCANCNLAVGNVREDIEIAEGLLRYLRQSLSTLES